MADVEDEMDAVEAPSALGESPDRILERHDMQPTLQLKWKSEIFELYFFASISLYDNIIRFNLRILFISYLVSKSKDKNDNFNLYPSIAVMCQRQLEEFW